MVTPPKNPCLHKNNNFCRKKNNNAAFFNVSGQTTHPKLSPLNPESTMTDFDPRSHANQADVLAYDEYNARGHISTSANATIATSIPHTVTMDESQLNRYPETLTATQTETLMQSPTQTQTHSIQINGKPYNRFNQNRMGDGVSTTMNKTIDDTKRNNNQLGGTGTSLSLHHDSMDSNYSDVSTLGRQNEV